MTNEKNMKPEIVKNAPESGMSQLDEIDESNDERMMETIKAISGQDVLYNK